jgi:hypothetical protein
MPGYSALILIADGTEEMELCAARAILAVLANAHYPQYNNL